jgi:erythromycin esterase-like protein
MTRWLLEEKGFCAVAAEADWPDAYRVNRHVRGRSEDATAEAATEGELTIGQLVRERHPRDCRLVGFTTYTGTVTAASDWEDPAERKLVRPALPGSVEELFHEVGEKAFWVPFGSAPRAAEALRAARLERAIGVVYRWSAPSSGTGARLRRPTHSPSEPRLRHRAQSDPRCSSGI